MTTVLLAGLGEVGMRCARQLLETPGVEKLLIATRPSERSREALAVLGSTAERISWEPGSDVPKGVDVIASALPSEPDLLVASAAVRAGVPLASAADTSESAEGYGWLNTRAREAGVTIAIGCGFSPGLSCVLASHAATLFDEPIEIRVARCGISGEMSERSVRLELRPLPQMLRDGKWSQRSRISELVWFPEPIGARDCQVVTAMGPQLAEVFPGLERFTWLLAESARKRLSPTALKKRDPDDGWGAIRVEVFGRTAGAVSSVVYGAVDRTALATGVVLGATAARLGGLGASPLSGPGVHSLAAIVEPIEFLGELAAQGVCAAKFEGALAS